MTSRHAQKRSKPTLIVGHGIAAVPTGHFDEARPMAQLPKKVPGKHRWIAMACFVMSDEQAANALDADKLKFLDHESLFEFSCGCWDCEGQLGTTITADSICPTTATE